MTSQTVLKSRPVIGSRIPANLLGALRGVNGELLEGLRRSILAGRDVLPIPKNIARRIAGMDDGQIDRCARCGILLVDLHLPHATHTADQRGMEESDYELDSTMPSETWLSSVQFVSLAHSTLMTAWHWCQWDRDVAAVLLGVELSFAQSLAQIEPIEISLIARKFGHCLLPRWHDREEIWHDLLSLGVAGNSKVAINLAVRGLQLSGALYRHRMPGVQDDPAAGTRQFGRKLKSNLPLSAART